MQFRLERDRTDKIGKDAVVRELEKVARHYGNSTFTCHEFDSVATKCKATTVLRNFGSWDKALRAIGIDLAPRRSQRSDAIPDAELFAELERVWRIVGHRPSRSQWEAASPNYGYSTYYKRFRGWLNACAAFSEFKSQASKMDISAESGKATARFASRVRATRGRPYSETGREVPLKIRYEVLRRDRYRCVRCGKSPATDSATILHVDHIVPFARGGTSTAGNLQALCLSCNLGKGASIEKE